MGLTPSSSLYHRMRVLCVCLLLVVGGSQEMMEKIMRNIDQWNFDSTCWGSQNALKWNLALMKFTEECYEWGPASQLLRPNNPFTKPNPANPFVTLPAPINRGNLANQWASMWSDYLQQRNKRQAEEEEGEGLLKPTEEDKEEFLRDYQEFKAELGTKMGNLTCVLTKMNMLDSALQVNMPFYTSGFWDIIDLKETLAGEDPVWRQRMVSGYSDCYQIAHTWPKESLDRNPLTKVFGRHMLFFKCAKKLKKKMCAAAQMDSWLTTMYGDDSSFDFSQYGLPQDRYDRAVLSTLVMYEQSSPEEEFVGEFFYGGSGM